MNDSLQNFVHNMWNLYALKGFAAKASWFSSIWKDNSATRMYIQSMNLCHTVHIIWNT